MNVCRITIEVTTQDDISTLALAGLVMPYVDKLKQVTTPEGVNVTCHVGDPHTVKTKKAAKTEPTTIATDANGEPEIPESLRRVPRHA